MHLKINPEIVIRAEEKSAMLFNKFNADTMLITYEAIEVLEKYFKLNSVIPKDFLHVLITKGYLIPSFQKDEQKESLEVITKIKNQAQIRKAPLNSLYAPETIHFSLTNTCNQNCIGCFYSKSEIEEERYLNPATYKRIVKKSSELKVFQYALGGGEPTLHDDLIEFCYLASEHNIIPNITTNGNLFNRKMAKELKQANLGQIQFSLNGSNEELNSHTRPNYSKTMKAIKIAKEVGLRWGINFLVTRSNLSDVPNMIQLADKLGAHTLNFLRVKPPIVKGSTWVKDESLSPAQHKKLSEMLYYANSLTKITVDASFCFLFNHLSSNEMYERGMWGCSAAQRFCTISPEGHVLACSHMHHHWDIGNGEFDRAWKGESKVFQQFRELNAKITGACAFCSIKETCKGCRAIVELLNGNFWSSDPQCLKLA
ncbi:MAG: radical SAM/SPASM domain-containing protein [Candidatus Heimdallarchaeaceae archaeon]